ncbi:DNA helicase IV [Actinopolyspora mzabensis]|uniref:DNA helicase IV n=1 Tax=Actinopolyspora mzabensis TaxID=995066 RepID=A0A1G8Z0W9_ACTMZ|nr:AAA family ATPase [Actinopolyspora mzabensis]SDK08617.1 DNA helicase IV [Actinopolyspora mzabensis]
MSETRADRELDHADSVAAEQRYVSMLYDKLDELRRYNSKRLAETLRETGGTPQARTERDISTKMHIDKLSQLSAVENGLCFGRLDLDSEERFHIGRLGLFDEENEYAPLLIDWRAPAARPFYLATAASRDGVIRRRHIRTTRRTVTDLEDEVLDLDSAEQGSHLGLAGEATLLAALDERRTGQMGDIVATIQAEQDNIIRSGMNGVLVVQGGPGTGKTAVALHRAAYLLYTYRQQLTKRGVLVVGPNKTFLRYIGQVLPSLGETGVLLSTVGELYPGVVATATDTATAAELKGRTEMVSVLNNAVRDRQQVPRKYIEVTFDREPLHIDKSTCSQARTKARRARKPHNEARKIFRREMFSALALQVADRLGRDLLDQRDIDDIAAELRADSQVCEVLEQLWPEIEPTTLLDELLSSPERMKKAARRYFDESQRQAMLREPGSEWTPADAPLLDELAELLGEDDSEQQQAQLRQEREELAYAEGVLHIMEQDEEIMDPERLRVSDVLDADLLADRNRTNSELTAAERAAGDRTWTFGHVIVDEAQELSAMAWRVIMRRCPSRSMTVVGDIAQTGSAAGASSWHDVLGPYVARRWRLEELTINYRTPSEIMSMATPLLAEMDVDLSVPTSVRSTGIEPSLERASKDEGAARTARLAAEELEAVEGGHVAVLCPPDRREEFGDEISALIPRAAVGPRPEGLEAPVMVLSVDQAKGLEFDSVIVADPAGILEQSPRGVNDIYVALTRTTTRLSVVHHGDLPTPLEAPEN